MELLGIRKRSLGVDQPSYSKSSNKKLSGSECVLDWRVERESVASLVKAMVILYGTPANMLEACAELEGGGLPEVGWVKEDGI